jgi:diguanylate cyclase (GGDEF)-like protein
MALSRRLSYAILGAVTSATVPLGLLLLRMAAGSTSSIVDELTLNRVIYAYVCVASAIASTSFGYAIGRQADELHRLATTDSLTELLNRRAMEDLLQREHGRAKRYGLPLSLLLIDLDGLKRINDLGGHGAGDQALRKAAKVIRSTLRDSDYGGRWGGDEFVILAPHTPPDSAHRLAERVAFRIATRSSTDRLRTTASIGVATLHRDRPTATTANALVEEADRALYDAKHGGRNRVRAS